MSDSTYVYILSCFSEFLIKAGQCTERDNPGVVFQIQIRAPLQSNSNSLQWCVYSMCSCRNGIGSKCRFTLSAAALSTVYVNATEMLLKWSHCVGKSHFCCSLPLSEKLQIPYRSQNISSVSLIYLLLYQV